MMKSNFRINDFLWLTPFIEINSTAKISMIEVFQSKLHHFKLKWWSLEFTPSQTPPFIVLIRNTTQGSSQFKTKWDKKSTLNDTPNAFHFSYQSKLTIRLEIKVMTAIDSWSNEIGNHFRWVIINSGIK